MLHPTIRLDASVVAERYKPPCKTLSTWKELTQLQCSACQHKNPSDSKFCFECGGPLDVRCPQCQAPVPAGVKFCNQCGARLESTASRSTVQPQRTPVPPGPTPAPDGERRQLTALFCDLVGSTDIASRLDPEEWHRISKEYQQATAAAVTRFGGHVDKFLGDGLVCFFGVPQAHEDDAERAVRAGLTIVDVVRGLNGKDAPLIHLQVRVGIHTGSAVVAHGGGASQDVFGDTPNIAARVQGAAAPDTVVITAATQRLVTGLFIVEERGAQPLKGVPQPVTLYRVVQASGVRSRLEVSVGRHTPFIGRQSELGALADAWEHVVEGMGQTVLVQGEAGIGKSRLCYQLREQLSDQPHTWLECRCSSYTAGTPFRPLIELVEQALTFQPTDTPAGKLGKLTLGLEPGGFEADETVALLAEWLELPESAGYVPLVINPDVKRRKTLETLTAWNLKLAELQPMVVLVEDLQWCDPSSLELLARLVAQSAATRMLLIGTARAEFTNPWPARSNLQTLTLSRLTERQTREMIAALSAARPLPEAVVEQLVTRADGIPLFAEELTQAVVEAGSDAAVTVIPVTLQDSLLARLDRISGAKEVARRAAVLGREFSYALLAAVAGLDAGALQQGLARLVEAELVFVRGEPPEATYTFKHALVQEAAYESLLKRTRQQLHGRVVDVLVAELAERADPAPEVVARHAELAGRTDEAVTYYHRAGEQAQARSAHEEAIGQFRQAIALLGTRPAGAERDARELTLQLALGASLIAARGPSHAETEAAYERAVALAAAAGDPARLGMARIGLSIFYNTRGEVERGRALAAEVLVAAEARGDREQALIGHANVVGPEFYQGKFASSLEHCERAIALYDPVRHHALVRVLGTDQGVAVLSFAAWNLGLLGRLDAALARAREAVALARRLNHPFSLAFALYYETVAHWFRRDVAAQRERAAEVIALSEAQGFPLCLGIGRTLHATARVTQGDPGALPEIMEGLALAAETGNQSGAPGMFVFLAEAQQTAGQLPEAQGTVATALAIAAQTGQPYFDSDLHRLDGEIVVATGGADDEAAARYHRALAVARDQDARSLELRAATSLARLWQRQGKRDAARDLLAPVYEWFTEGFETRDLIEAKALLEEL
jgi:class 3 adenylate cyclase/predicted ATPase